jgi:hypothetical protein
VGQAASCFASEFGSASCSPRNARNVDLLVASLLLCQQTASADACGTAASVAGADAVRRYVVGAASALNVEPAESLTCASYGGAREARLQRTPRRAHCHALLSPQIPVDEGASKRDIGARLVNGPFKMIAPLTLPS